MMSKIIAKRYRCVVLMVLSILLVSCGSGQDTSGQNNQGTGSVAVLLTDAPIDNFNKFIITVSEISLLGDDGSVSLFSGNETIDLLNLNSHSDLFSLTTNIQAGRYYKVRMKVSDPQLIRLDMDGNILETVVPNMGGNGKLDLNPRGDIIITSGQILALQLDMDVEKSIHLVQNGNGQYRFRPVVFVDILTDNIKGKLVRISGYADDIEESSFELCQNENNTNVELPDINDEDDEDDKDEYQNEDHCVKIYTDSSTSFFNDQGNSVLASQLMDDKVVTVLGYYSYMKNNSQLGFNAEVIELAAADVFQTYNGVIESIEGSIIELRTPEDTLTTVLFSSATKVFDLTGKAMLLEDLRLGMSIKLEGVYDAQNERVNSAVIFVEPVGISKLAGSFVSFHNDLTGFDMMDNTQGDACVTVDENVNIYLLTLDDNSFQSEVIDFSELQSGQYMEVYGSFNAVGCFVADSLLVESL